MMTCNAPQVCCVRFTGGGVNRSCVDPGSCSDGGVTLGCAAGTCGSGEVCCASGFGGGGIGGTQCEAMCGMGQVQLCSMTDPCPPGEHCRLRAGSMDGTCRPGDAGIGGFDRFPPPPFDAGGD
jgi:hypothetical protein